MKTPFGTLPSGEQTYLYTIENTFMRATLCDFGATLVSLWIPDQKGNLADVVLGHDSVEGYACDDSCMGAVVGRNANRIAGAKFSIGERQYQLTANDGANSLHSLPNGYSHRIWHVAQHRSDRIVFTLESPHLDQGFPGNAQIRVTYLLENNALSIIYDGISDMDTVFNLTNHSFFNLAGQDQPEMAMQQELILPARTFAPSDGAYIPTGEDRSVAGSPMDFRQGKPIGRDIDADYECLQLQGGYDHTFEVFTEPCAILCDPVSGRTMAIVTDCPGVHLYTGNFLSGESGKGGVSYCRRSGICLETHFYPDALHKPHWKQPITKAGEPYHSRTKFIFR